MSELEEKHKKRKSITLKSSIIEEEDEKCKEEDIGLIIRKFKSFLKKKQGRRDFMKNSYKGDKEPIIWYEWKKLGHMMLECSLLKKRKK